MQTIKNLWSFGIDISAKEIIERSYKAQMQLTGPLLEKDCDHLFSKAKEKQQQINKAHPARGVLSNEVKDFYKVN